MRLAALLLALLLSACGGGGGSSGVPATPVPPPTAPTSLDKYLPFFNGGQRLKGIVQNQDTGEKYTEWRAESNKIWWSLTDSELLDVRYCEGGRWSFLLGFENAAAAQFYRLQNVKTTRNGKLLDCPQDGAPYQPFDIPIDFQDTVEQWGKILVPEGEIQYYWKAEFTYGTRAENPCWIGDGPKLRAVIVQREVWWDENGGWVRGKAESLPWFEGHPVDVEPTMDWMVKNAMDNGLLWLAGDAKLHLCLKDIVGW